ncbi:MAG: VCBS repeat-containing protein, partial [Planctomycetes bacterium]|nr:VCBS repeat-containing protein [Planctomycetota bacterium]
MGAARLGLMIVGVGLIGGCGSPPPDDVVPNSTPPAVAAPLDGLAADGRWDPEAYQDRTAEQLKLIVAALTRRAPDGLERLSGSGFETTDLRPPADQAESVYKQNGARVLRWDLDNNTPATLAGVDGLRRALEQLRSSWPGDARRPRVKLKQFGIEPRGDEIVSQVSYRAYAQGAKTGVQQTATWTCGWDYVAAGDGDSPRLRWLRLEHLEEVQVEMIDGEPLLVDATESLMGEMPCYQQQLRHGANHWITRYPQLKHRFHHGIAIGDVDADGREDLYICQPEGLPNLLLLRTPSGGVREAATAAGIDWLDSSRSALLVDLDNDGDQDLALLTLVAFVVFENVGGTKFEKRGYFPRRGRLTSLCAADYDNDGLVDIYVCGYSGPVQRGRLSDPVPMPDAIKGGENALFKNRGQCRFEDVT